jgi:hypothetical protein
MGYFYLNLYKWGLSHYFFILIQLGAFFIFFLSHLGFLIYSFFLKKILFGVPYNLNIKMNYNYVI